MFCRWWCRCRVYLEHPWTWTHRSICDVVCVCLCKIQIGVWVCVSSSHLFCTPARLSSRTYVRTFRSEIFVQQQYPPGPHTRGRREVYLFTLQCWLWMCVFDQRTHTTSTSSIHIYDYHARRGVNFTPAAAVRQQKEGWFSCCLLNFTLALFFRGVDALHCVVAAVHYNAVRTALYTTTYWCSRRGGRCLWYLAKIRTVFWGMDIIVDTQLG